MTVSHVWSHCSSCGALLPIEYGLWCYHCHKVGTDPVWMGGRKVFDDRLTPSDFLSDEDRARRDVLKTRVQAYERTRYHTQIRRDPTIYETGTVQSERLPSRTEWVSRQKEEVERLSAVLELKHVSELIRLVSRVCKLCGKPVPKRAHLDLCQEHRIAHQKMKNRVRQRRFRSK